MFVRGESPSVPGREVLQQLNPRSTGTSQRRNAQMSAKYVIQMFLLGSVVFALTGDTHSEQVVIELDAGVGVPHHDCSVIDSEEQLVGRAVPLLWALVRGELQHLDRMPIR